MLALSNVALILLCGAISVSLAAAGMLQQAARSHIAGMVSSVLATSGIAMLAANNLICGFAGIVAWGLGLYLGRGFARWRAEGQKPQQPAA